MAKSTERKLAGLSWSESFNCYRTALGGWLILEFSWDSTGPKETPYKLIFAGRALNVRAKSPEEAALKLTQYTKNMLQSTLTTLEAAQC